MNRKTWGRRLAVSTLILLSLLAAKAIRAQQNEEASVLRLFFQEKELVTAASRVPEEARTAPSTVEVFTADDIQNMGARTLSDLLNTLESVYVATNPDSREAVWVRGIRQRYNDKILLMVDGTPWRDIDYENAFINEYFPLCEVERVEVIRGPGSALYGTNAFAGVINVVTKKPPEKSYAEAMLGGGDYDTKEAYVQGGFRQGSVGLYAWGNYYESDGDGAPLDRKQREQSLLWNPKQNISGGFNLTAGEFALSFEKIHFYHTMFDDWDVPAWRWNDQGEGYWYNDSFLTGSYQHHFGDAFSVRALGYYQDYDLRDFWRNWAHQGPNSTPADVLDVIDVAKKGHRAGADFQATVNASSQHEIVCGLTYEREVNSQTTDHWTDMKTGAITVPFYINPVMLTTWAVYAQDTWKPAPWATVTLGVRSDHSSVFGWKTTPRIGAAFHPGSKLVLKLLYGEAFRSPSSRELYTVDLTQSFIAGNPNLKPESIRTVEGSATYTFSHYAEAHLLLYYESTRNLIYAEQNEPYENHPGTIIRGLETGVRLAWPNRITAYGNYSYTRGEPYNPATRTDLYNVPHNLAHVGVNIPWGDHLNWNINAIYVSSRPRDPNDEYWYDPVRSPYHRPDVPGYIVANTTLRLLKIGQCLELNASVYNIFNKTYFDPTYEPTYYNDIQLPSRTFVVRALLRF